MNKMKKWVLLVAMCVTAPTITNGQFQCFRGPNSTNLPCWDPQINGSASCYSTSDCVLNENCWIEGIWIYGQIEYGPCWLDFWVVNSAETDDLLDGMLVETKAFGTLTGWYYKRGNGLVSCHGWTDFDIEDGGYPC